MPSQIPSAFLIRALARSAADHCERCGHRMFVKQPSGLCPFCKAGRPVRPVEHPTLPMQAREPFAPVVGDARAWQRLPLGQRLREMVSRARRPARAAEATSTS
jgi:hypothetical protein